MRMLAILALLGLAGCGAPRLDVPATDVSPAAATEALAHDADDPAVWIHPTEPVKSLILGTDKTDGPDGSLAVFDLDGRLLQTLGGIARPNNVDTEYGLSLAGRPVDIAVVTERERSRLRVFRIPSDGGALTEIAVIPVFEGETGDAALPMGIGLYRRPADGVVFAIVSRKAGPTEGYLWQYRLEDTGDGGIRGVKVRAFGSFSGTGEIEAIAVDDPLGHVYYADELAGIRKYHGDPDHIDAGRELARFGVEEFAGDREGIALYAGRGGSGYIVCSDQLRGNSRYLLFDRQTHQLRHVLRAGADSTDGIEAVSAALGPRYPRGMLVVMNSSGRNFLLAPWPGL